ncbi:MAG TPA: DEAD/DEAH box helicase [Planctomycetota bacterium]|nr:DEAD/DEAH box helicase [Planctomycetota bacterium]
MPSRSRRPRRPRGTSTASGPTAAPPAGSGTGAGPSRKRGASQGGAASAGPAAGAAVAGTGAAGGATARASRAVAATPVASRGPKAPAETFRGLTLNDFQMQALGPLREGRPVLLAAPTGSGKTLVAEIAIEQSLQAGRRAIYTAPVKALSNQKYRDFKAIAPEAVGIMTGDVTINGGAPLLIMTTEIFRNTIFENPASLDDVDTVVFDEIHYMDDLERGTVWEESIIFAPRHIRFVCLSATIANLDQFGEWISATRGQQVEIIRHRERPVPLDHYLWIPGMGLRRIDGKLVLPRVPPATRGHGRGGGHAPRGQDRNAIVDLLQRDRNLPALFFCFSRRECEQRARETLHKRNLLEAEQGDRIEQLFNEICDVFEIVPDTELEELRSLVRHGIAYHHAGMLPLHKELVERLFTSGLLQLLFATETFSLGINMPAHTVVFASLRKFDGTGFSTLKVREYQQMAGRAGRQGIDTHGLVISILDDDRVTPHEIARLVGNDVEPILSRFNLSYSTLINLHRTLGERLFEAWERSFNNFQWSRMSTKKREKNAQKQRQAIEQRLHLLRTLGYITEHGVTPKGDVAAVINGYELQVAELLESGLLEWLNEIQIAIVFASLVFEERKNELFRRLPANVLGEHRKDIERVVDNLIRQERELGIPPSIRPPNFRIAAAVNAWCQGIGFADMREHCTAPNGDIVRVFRLTVQLLRQLRSTVPPKSPLATLLERSRALLNRDEVDAARQLSLG